MGMYLVAVGQRTPLSINTEDAQDAAFQASLEIVTRNIAQPPALIVMGDDGVKRFNFSDRKCKKCGCTEERACKEICCWMAWDLCSNCVE